MIKTIKHIIITFIILVIWSSHPVFAQTRQINGQVIKTNESIPLVGIKISIKGINQNVKTDTNGNFTILVPDTLSHIIFDRVKNMSIEKIEKDAKGDYKLYLKPLDIKAYFEMSLDELIDIEVSTASRKEQKASDIPASIVLITREDIERYGYTTLDEIFQDIPGFFVMPSHGAADKIFGVRGFYSAYNRNVIIMVNGVNQINDFTNDFKLYEINVPVEIIDRIEIIRGPMSVIYGNNALFGAINIITNDYKDSKNIVSGTYGSRNTQKLIASVGVKREDVSLHFNTGYYHTDGINQTVNKMVDENILTELGLTKNPLWDKNTDGLYHCSQKYIDINGEIKHFSFDLSYTESYKGHSYYSFPPKQYWLQPSALRAMAAYKWLISNNFWFETKGTYNIIRQESRFKLSSANDYGPLFEQTTAWQTELNGHYSPSGKINLSFGLYSRIITEATQRYDITAQGNGTLERAYLNLDPDDEIINYATFAQAAYKPTNKLDIIGGVRFNKYEPYNIFITRKTGTPDQRSYFGTNSKIDKWNFIPRFALLYHPNNKNSIKILYGKAINHAPAISNLDILIYNATHETKESYLKPESIETIELNYISTVGRKLFINSSIFYNTLKNLLIREVKFVDGEYAPITTNGGKMSTFGMELNIKWQSRKFMADLSAMVQQSKNKHEGYKDIRVAFSPEKMASLKLSYNIDKDLSISLTSKYIDGMYPFWIGTPEDGNYQGEKTNAFVLMNANISKENLFFAGFYTNLRIYNALGIDYFFPTHEVQPWATKGFIGRGREFIFSLGYKF